jgi:hypothetical protein
MAEREGIAQLPYYDDPEALKLARIASEQMGEQEFIEDEQYRLTPETRFGGIYGMVPRIGYRDSPSGETATIRSMGAPTWDKDNRYILVGNQVKLGEYVPKSFTPEDIARENLNPDFQPGMAPGSVHYFQNRDLIASETESIDTPEQADRQIASTINHELFHRGSDVLPLDALEKYARQRQAEEKARDAEDAYKYELAKWTFGTLKSGYGQHEYTTALRKVIDPGEKKEPLQQAEKNRLKELKAADEVMREFFTPERQEQYQIRLPTRSAEPKETELPTRSAEPEEKGLGALFRRLFD